MGQDTYIKFGVTVCLNLSYDNIKLVQKLLQNHIKSYDDFGICCYVITDYDEINLFDETELYNKMDDLYSADSEAEFYKRLASKIELKFIIKCASAYARNISRRDNSHIFGDDQCESVDKTCEKLMTAKKMFIDLGVSENQIWTGYTVYDSY